MGKVIDFEEAAARRDGASGIVEPTPVPFWLIRLYWRLTTTRDRIWGSLARLFPRHVGLSEDGRWHIRFLPSDEQDRIGLIFLAGSLWGSFLTGGVILALLHRLH